MKQTTCLPRERLLEHGVEVLSEQELLAIILRTGTTKISVMSLAKSILDYFEGLQGLKQASLAELQKIPGIGQVRATEITALLRLAHLLSIERPIKLGKVISSQSLGEYLIQELKDLRQEVLLVIYLNTKNEMIKKEILFKGTLNQSIAHPREIYHGAVKCAAARFVMAHNHPSGHPLSIV